MPQGVSVLERDATVLDLGAVRGLRPWRAARLLVVNVPNPATVTGSPPARASLMDENMASITESAVALDREAWVATWDEMFDLFIRARSWNCGWARLHWERSRPFGRHHCGRHDTAIALISVTALERPLLRRGPVRGPVTTSLSQRVGQIFQSALPAWFGRRSDCGVRGGETEPAAR